MNRLRVLHLVTSTGGGAGIAARRLHEALIENKIESSLITLTNHTKYVGIIELKRNLFNKVKSSILTALQSTIIQSTDQLLTPISKNSISTKDLTLDNYSIVHIHAFYNLISTARIIQLCKEHPRKRFFLTLHDERFLTGGCHYSHECINIQKECVNCPQATTIGKFLVKREYKKKNKSLNNLRNLILISPSTWMQTAALNNPATSKLQSYIVRNPIPKVFFDVASSRIPGDKLRIAFISAHLNTRIKDITTFIKAMNLIAEDGFSDRFELQFVGRGQVPSWLDSRIKFESVVTATDQETADILSQCQILVVPSIRDNLPSTMIEAICAGLSVIGTKIGGIEEVLSSYEQPTINVGDFMKLASELIGMLEHRPVPSQTKAANEFSYSAVSKRLVCLYETS